MVSLLGPTINTTCSGSGGAAFGVCATTEVVATSQANPNIPSRRIVDDMHTSSRGIPERRTGPESGAAPVMAIGKQPVFGSQRPARGTVPRATRPDMMRLADAPLPDDGDAR